MLSMMVVRVERFMMRVMMSRKPMVVSGRFTMMVKVARLSITRCHVHSKASSVMVVMMMFSHISLLSRLHATISFSLRNTMQMHNRGLLGIEPVPNTLYNRMISHLFSWLFSPTYSELLDLIHQQICAYRSSMSAYKDNLRPRLELPTHRVFANEARQGQVMRSTDYARTCEGRTLPKGLQGHAGSGGTPNRLSSREKVLTEEGGLQVEPGD